ncbi:MAG: aldolase [Ruminococcaceae bacterium]|nr:aldolase [Oscillospiraceae bacterium]
MHMRKSRVLKKIKEGGVAFCTKLNLSDPRAAEIAAMCGFDCIWLDMEHVPGHYIDLENMIRAAKISDCDVLTRIARSGGYGDIIRPLEADSTGIMVPHLMSLKDAKEIVYYSKFHPIGRRPLDGGNADGKYCLVDGADYIKEANEERFTVIQIEDPEPMEELEEICALPGIDMIFFGPADFSQGLGIPFQMSDERLVKARKLVAETARKHGKMAGTVAGIGNVQSLIDEGYNFISIGADVVALFSYYQNIIKETEKLTNK